MCICGYKCILVEQKKKHLINNICSRCNTLGWKPFCFEALLLYPVSFFFRFVLIWISRFFIHRKNIYSVKMKESDSTIQTDPGVRTLQLWYNAHSLQSARPQATTSHFWSCISASPNRRAGLDELKYPIHGPGFSEVRFYFQSTFLFSHPHH